MYGVCDQVMLSEFEKAKETWEMEPEDKLTQSDLAKTKGTSYLKVWLHSSSKSSLPFSKLVLI